MISTPVFKRIVVVITFLILISIVSLSVWIHLQHQQKDKTSITTINKSLINNAEVKNIYNNESCGVFNSNSSFENSTINNTKLEIPKVTLKKNETNDNNHNTTKSTQVKIFPRSMNTDENSTEDNNAPLKPIEPINSNNNETFKSNSENTEIKIQPSALRNDTESFPEIITPIIDGSKNISDDDDDKKIFETEASNDDVKCYGELGCLSIPISWYHPVYRPLNLFPLSREDINTIFVLYTRKNLTKGQILKEGENNFVKQSNFDPKRRTKFIIHGYIDTSLSNWVKEMKNELLEYDDYNVIAVDWAGGSSLSIIYTQAVANTRIVGLEIAHLISHLHVRYGLKLDDVHLIGHSLGAHTAGYAGEKLQGEIGRISALDPAKPDFENMPSYVRLDWTDAKLVDVIHSGSEGILRTGVNHPCGHLDFYPNNGDDQPGCTSLILAKFCNHVRAIKLFTESINSECQFTAYECNNYENFIGGECFSCKNNNSLSCGIMGYHADKSPALKQRSVKDKFTTDSSIGSKFFISTGDRNPFCRTQYRIKIQLAKLNEFKTWVRGSINVTLHADNGIIPNMQLDSKGDRLKLHYGEATTVIAVPAASFTYDLGRIRKIELTWTCSTDTFLLFCCSPCDDPLYVDKIIVDKPELPLGQGISKRYFSSTLYATQGLRNYTKIKSGSSVTFVDNYEEYKDTHVTS